MCAGDPIDDDGDTVGGAESVSDDEDGDEHVDAVDYGGSSVGRVGTAIGIIVDDCGSILGG